MPVRRIVIPLLVCSLALTACADEEPELTGEDIARIEQSLMNGSELAWELVQTEARVAAMCMQDLGFDVHHPDMLHGGMYPDRFEGFTSPYSRIPTVEQAERFGFGSWLFYTDTDAAAELREDPAYLAFIADDIGWIETEEGDALEAWDAQGQEYQDAWLEAFKGTEQFLYDRAMNDAYEEDPEAAMETDFGPSPPFGGCELETLEIVYGGPGKGESEGEEFWYRPLPETPLTWVGDGDVYTELSARYVDEEQDFLFCVEDRGYGEWEFDGLGWLPTGLYLEQLYDPGIEYSDDQGTPPLTGEAEDADDPQAYEFAMALDFAECAEASGLRGATDEAWAELYVERFVGREAEVYAWEQEIRDYLANAQDHIAGS